MVAAARSPLAPLMASLLIFAFLLSGAGASRSLTDRRQLAQTGSTAVFINEIHWDNLGLDFGEAVEIMGPVGTDLVGYTLTRYAGGSTTNGKLCTSADCAPSYKGPVFTFPAGSVLQGDGSATATQTGRGTLVIVFPADGLSNSGAGLSLADASGQVADFISWRSSGSGSANFVVTAVAGTGPASGLSSTPVQPGQESSSSSPGVSIQRLDATNWASSPASNTFGPTYQNYFTTANPSGVDACELASDGTISYGGCAGKGPFTSPVTQPPKYSEGPRVIGAGALPDLTVVQGLVAASGYRGNAPSSSGSPTPAPTGTGTDTPTPTPTGTGTLAPTATGTGTPAPTGTGSGTGTPGPTSTGTCGSASETPIYSINGNGAAPNLVGSKVVTSGIITGAFDGPNQLSGFYIQTPDAAADADSTTSNGIFVYFGSSRASFPSTLVGDYVQVAGTVANFNGLPEITTITALTICTRGNTLPAVPQATLPASGAQGLRQFLGMQVNFPQTFTVTDNYNDDYYGEIKLSINGRRYVPTQLVSPGAPALALEASNAAQTILLDDGSSKTGQTTPLNPIPYPAPGLSDSNTIRTGYTLTSTLNGDLSFGNSYGYLLEPINPSLPGVTFSADSNPRPTEAPAVGGRLKVVGMNLENFFTQLQGPSCSSSNCRGASTQEEFNTQLSKEVLAITALNADVYAFQELQNNGFGPGSAIATLTAAVNNKVGAGTYAFITVNQPDGGSPSVINPDPNCAVQCVGGDAITVGIVYRVAAVTPVGPARALTKNIDPDFNSDIMRPSVAQTFVDTSGGKFTVVANHLKSKGSACTALGDPDTGDGQGNCNLTRQKAASAIVRWLATDPTGSTDSDFLLLGDMNAYAMEDPIKAFEAGGYVNMLKLLIGDTAYSYVFNGETGYLDHALASPSLVTQIKGIAEFHINADEPIALHYDNPAGLANPNSMYRCSDHDPLITGIDLTPSAAPTTPAPTTPSPTTTAPTTPSPTTPAPTTPSPTTPSPTTSAPTTPAPTTPSPTTSAPTTPAPTTPSPTTPAPTTPAPTTPAPVTPSPTTAAPTNAPTSNPSPVPSTGAPTPTNGAGGCGNSCNCPNENSCTKGASKSKCAWTGTQCVLKA